MDGVVDIVCRAMCSRFRPELSWAGRRRAGGSPGGCYGAYQEPTSRGCYGAGTSSEGLVSSYGRGGRCSSAISSARVVLAVGGSSPNSFAQTRVCSGTRLSDSSGRWMGAADRFTQIDHLFYSGGATEMNCGGDACSGRENPSRLLTTSYVSVQGRFSRVSPRI